MLRARDPRDHAFALDIRTHASSKLTCSWPLSFLTVSRNATLEFIFSVWKEKMQRKGTIVTLLSAFSASYEGLSLEAPASSLVELSKAINGGLHIRLFVDLSSTDVQDDDSHRCPFLRRVRFSSRYLELDSKALGDYRSTQSSHKNTVIYYGCVFVH
jgi:hypothetical protein